MLTGLWHGLLKAFTVGAQPPADSRSTRTNVLGAGYPRATNQAQLPVADTPEGPDKPLVPGFELCLGPGDWDIIDGTMADMPLCKPARQVVKRRVQCGGPLRDLALIL
jgi:hypothetical protein